MVVKFPQPQLFKRTRNRAYNHGYGNDHKFIIFYFALGRRGFFFKLIMYKFLVQLVWKKTSFPEYLRTEVTTDTTQHSTLKNILSGDGMQASKNRIRR